MKFTANSQFLFHKSIAEAIKFLNEEELEMSDPCIYAETGGVGRREIGFCFGPKQHMQEGDILWVEVQPDSFGEYDAAGDLEIEADAITSAMWSDAVNDISAAI